MKAGTAYPANAAARDHFILDRRAGRPRHDPWRHQGVLVENERTADGRIVRAATVFLSGRECPWRCVMCDLWRYTTVEDTPRTAIPAQVAAACEELRRRADGVSLLKLYNSGSFFDPRAVPVEDYDEIAARLDGLARVVVESHPALVGPRLDRFLEALNRQCASGLVQLEVAMGLETAHPEALQSLNKRMTVEDFAAAAGYLRERGVSVRTFLLIAPPFVPPDDQEEWLLRSIEVAFSAGASVVSLVPTRAGNGAMEALAAVGAFSPPGLDDVERSLARALAAHGAKGRIFADLWDLQRFSTCATCFGARRARLDAINVDQRVLPRPSCAACGVGTI